MPHPLSLHFVLFKVKDLVAKQHPTNTHTQIEDLGARSWWAICFIPVNISWQSYLRLTVECWLQTMCWYRVSYTLWTHIATSFQFQKFQIIKSHSVAVWCRMVIPNWAMYIADACRLIHIGHNTSCTCSAWSISIAKESTQGLLSGLTQVTVNNY